MITLDESYERCRELNKRHGTTYYWSTYALPRIKRHHVHALYGFTRIDSPEWDILSTDRDRIVPIAREAPSWT